VAGSAGVAGLWHLLARHCGLAAKTTSAAALQGSHDEAAAAAGAHVGDRGDRAHPPAVDRQAEALAVLREVRLGRRTVRLRAGCKQLPFRRVGVWSRRSHPSSPVPAAAGRILAPKKAKKHTKTLIKSKLNKN
jgi:hypothetical protein